MQKALGIGGVFIRARDPEAMAAWYQKNLGITTDQGIWRQNARPTVFAPFPEDTDYFGDPKQTFMLNLRVADLAAMTAQLEKAGIEVVTKEEWNCEVGIFARVHDPEGNPIELWQMTEGVEDG